MNDQETDVTVRLPGALLALLRELGELKRVRSVGRAGSIMERLFADGWSRLVAGLAVGAAMRGHTGRALTMVRLGDVDAPVLRDLSVDEADVGAALRRAFASVSGAVDPSLAESLLLGREPPQVRLPEFVARLAAQPRAGATCPDRPRLVFEPAENHAEHCAAVAVYGVLLSPVFGADPATVWLASMAHHLHNAFIPDAGFAGEVLLGDLLAPLMGRAQARCLAELAPDLALQVRTALVVTLDADSPEGRAFHAADTLDRVWQIDQHLRPGRIGLDQVLGDMALVHDGPVKPFQERVLHAAGLI